jgi:hypothetical protein
MTYDCSPYSLNLATRYPARLERLKANITVQQLRTAFGLTSHPAPELFAVFHALWHQHDMFSNLPIVQCLGLNDFWKSIRGLNYYLTFYSLM